MQDGPNVGSRALEEGAEDAQLEEDGQPGDDEDEEGVDGPLGNDCPQCLGKRDAVVSLQHATAGELTDARNDQRGGVAQEDSVDADRRARLLAQRLQRLLPAPAAEQHGGDAEGKRQPHPSPVHLIQQNVADVAEVELPVHPPEDGSSQQEGEYDTCGRIKDLFLFHGCKDSNYLLITLRISIFYRTFAAMKQVRPKKNLGQHFLTDLSIARRIADTVDACPDIPVLEVGPGMGVMTQYLVQKPRPLKVVEIDRESVAYLKDTLFRPTVTTLTSEPPIIEGDFLQMDLTKVFDGQAFVLTGNYPYDISSQIFFKMLDNRDLIPCCTGMIQREVAQRMASAPGTKAYGILSVLTQAWYDVEYLFTVDETVFNPPPKVKSAVIRMTRNQVKHLDCDELLFKRVVKTVFNQRRKMLRVSLRQLLPTAEAMTMVQQSAFATLRPEQLTVAQFVELTNLVATALSQ